MASFMEFAKKLVTSWSTKKRPKILNRKGYSLNLSLRNCWRFVARACLPILRNWLFSSVSAFVWILKAQAPITSVLNFAAASRHSTNPPFSTIFSKYFSKLSEHSTNKWNISFSFPDEKKDESLSLKGLHLSASSRKSCSDNGSTWKIILYINYIYIIIINYKNLICHSSLILWGQKKISHGIKI